ncbi:hypothetical protein AAHA92_23767 [Salvia divinorum]|uniref:Uncharacterized protein n=1 Tax=Salvia divinorum TaxID=28513 RepID=A0ABD1GW84_SALDI
MAKKSMFRYCLVDAFTDSAFKGNPAAVCLLEEERAEEWMLAVARELNAPVTCYLTRMPHGGDSNAEFRLRWFTTVREVKLCGHATLAASHFVFEQDLANSDTIRFSTMSRILMSKRIPQNASTFLIELDFPSIPLTECDEEDTPSILKSLNVTSVNHIYKTTTFEAFLIVVVGSSEAVVEVVPDFDEIRKLPCMGLIITGVAPAVSGFDFFTRIFAPVTGVDEDHVCGSAHCALVNYWSKQLGKHDFVAYQRSGVLNIHHDQENQRVLLRGDAVTIVEGSLFV